MSCAISTSLKPSTFRNARTRSTFTVRIQSSGSPCSTLPMLKPLTENLLSSLSKQQSLRDALLNYQPTCIMTLRILLLLALLVPFAVRADGPADNKPENVRPVPRKGAALSPAVREELEQGIAKLGDEIEGLRGQLKGKAALLALLPDVQIFHNAVRYAVQYNEIFNPTNEVPAARSLLKQGLDRATELREGKPSWISATGLVIRGYISRLDGSVQPYGLVVPASFQ